MAKEPPKARRGRPRPPGAFDAIGEAAARSRLEVREPLVLNPEGQGRVLTFDQDRRIFGLLSGAGSPYSLVQKHRTLTHGWATVAGGVNCSGCAYEINGRTGLAGKVVELDRGAGSNDWTFHYNRTGTTCTGQICVHVTDSGTGLPLQWAVVRVYCGGVLVSPLGPARTDANGDACVLVPKCSTGYTLKVCRWCYSTASVAVAGPCANNPPASRVNVALTPDHSKTLYLSDNNVSGLAATAQLCTVPTSFGVTPNPSWYWVWGYNITLSGAWPLCVPNVYGGCSQQYGGQVGIIVVLSCLLQSEVPAFMEPNTGFPMVWLFMAGCRGEFVCAGATVSDHADFSPATFTSTSPDTAFGRIGSGDGLWSCDPATARGDIAFLASGGGYGQATHYYGGTKFITE
jgi:hypothetical protein